MAITIKTLKGTNSVSADRITINDNFKINTDAINGLLGIVNTTTGKIDNTGVGADNTITTEAMTITTGGIDIQGGDLSLQDGDIKALSDGAKIELGTDGSAIVDSLVAVGASGPNSTHYVGVTGFIGYEVPRLTTVEITDVGANGLGATGPNLVTFDSDTNEFKGWNGVAWVVLG